VLCGWSDSTTGIAGSLFKAADYDRLVKRFRIAEPRYQHYFGARYDKKARTGDNLLDTILAALPKQHERQIGLVAIDAYNKTHLAAALAESDDWPWNVTEIDVLGRPFELWHPRRPITATERAIYRDANHQRDKARWAKAEADVARFRAERMSGATGR
jgi:hypothetical protein